MASSPDGKPLGESPEALFYDSVNLFASTVVTNVAYGVMLALYAICVHYFWRQMTSENRRRTTFYLCYITTMAVLGTFTVIMSAWTANIAFVKHRLYPKGPGAYIITMHSQPCMVLSGVSWMLSNFMADGLVVSPIHSLYFRLFILSSVLVVAIHRCVPGHSILLPHRHRTVPDVCWKHV